MGEHGFAAIGSGVGKLEGLGEGGESARHVVEIERAGDTNVLENVDLAGGEMFAGEDLLGGVVCANALTGSPRRR